MGNCCKSETDAKQATQAPGSQITSPERVVRKASPSLSPGRAAPASKTINVSLWSTGTPRPQLFRIAEGDSPDRLMLSLRASVGAEGSHSSFGLYQRGPWFGGPSGGEVELSWRGVESVPESTTDGRVDWRQGHYVLARQLVVSFHSGALKVPLARGATVASCKALLERAVYVPRRYQVLHGVGRDGVRGRLPDDCALEECCPSLQVSLKTLVSPVQHLTEQLGRVLRSPPNRRMLHGGVIPQAPRTGARVPPIAVGLSNVLNEGFLAPPHKQRLARSLPAPVPSVATTPEGHVVYELPEYPFQKVLGTGVSGVVSRCGTPSGGIVAVKQVRKQGDLYTIEGSGSASASSSDTAPYALGNSPRSVRSTRDSWHDVQWLLTEIVMLRELPHHENVLFAIDVAHDADRAYLVTPVLDTTLYDLMHEVELWREPYSFASLLRQLLAGVAHLHHNGVAHRDIKCENALISARSSLRGSGVTQYDLRICDFGLCRKFSDLGAFARTSPRAQTLMYSAPAAVEAFLHDMEGRCAARKAMDLTADDIFSVGACAFTMSCRRRAFAPMDIDPGDDAFWVGMVANMRKGLPVWAVSVGLWPLRGRLHYASDLVSALLHPDPRARPSAASALEHEWLCYGERGQPAPHSWDVVVPAQQPAQCGTLDRGELRVRHDTPFSPAPASEPGWDSEDASATLLRGVGPLTASERQYVTSQMAEALSSQYDGTRQHSIGRASSLASSRSGCGGLRPTQANRRWRLAGAAVRAALKFQRAGQSLDVLDVQPEWQTHGMMAVDATRSSGELCSTVAT
eukprot:TRINITY_DN39457_c0_g1_i1.p1 TRINITY_DN39457_c0_g1~~TRINITY_DN39457_c0_g1_i1.p1  ORF type:complete len:799 (+),score=187.29 TRINITY_DN39457_c0_g1_i1:81-2477(+)